MPTNTKTQGERIEKKNFLPQKRIVVMERSFKVNVSSGLSDSIHEVSKTEKTKLAIKAALAKHFLFCLLNEVAIESIIEVLQRTVIEPGTLLTKQGDNADTFYVLERGEVSVVGKGKRSVKKQVKGPGTFGDNALFYECKSVNTVKCTKQGVLWSISRTLLRQVIALSAAQGIIGRVEFLRNVPLLGGLNQFQLTRLAEAFTEVGYDNNEDIIVQGTKGSKFYVLTSGEVTVRKRNRPGAEYVKLVDLPEGAFFGERSLLENQPRNATCTSKGKSVCLVLDRTQFNKLLGPLKNIIAKTTQQRENDTSNKMAVAEATGAALRRSEEDEQNKQDEKSEAKSSKMNLEKQNKIIVPHFKPNDFSIIKVIGEGELSYTTLVRQKQSNKVMVVKSFQKSEVASKKQFPNIMREKTILSKIESPFVVRLLGIGVDKYALYLYLDFVQYGNLYDLLYSTVLQDRGHGNQKNNNLIPRTNLMGFPNNYVRWYIVNIICALQAVHKLGYIYRHIIPENFLLDNFGYLRMTNFVFCRRLSDGEKSQTLCGSIEYLAPEMLLSKGHDSAVDFWSLGCLMYELFVGKTPFFDTNPSNICKKILHSSVSVNFHPSFPKKPRDIIKQLLHPVPSLRIGMSNRSLIEHYWFTGVNWEGIQERKYQAPFSPTLLESESDCSYFPKIDRKENNILFTGNDKVFSKFI